MRGTAHRLAGALEATASTPSELDRPVLADIGRCGAGDYADQTHKFNSPDEAIEDEAGLYVLANSSDDLEALGLSHATSRATQPPAPPACRPNWVD